MGTELDDNLLTIEWQKTATVSIQHINLLFIPPFQGPQFNSLQKTNPHLLPQLAWRRVVWLYSPERRKGRAPNYFLDLPPSLLFPVPLSPHLQDDLIAAHISASQLSKFLIFSLSRLSGFQLFKKLFYSSHTGILGSSKDDTQYIFDGEPVSFNI